MNDSVPLLRATPLYGTTTTTTASSSAATATVEPQTVIYDESTLPQATLSQDSNNDNNNYQYNNGIIQSSTGTDDDDENLPSSSFAAAILENNTNYKQEEGPIFRDLPFAILFWIQFIIMIFLGVKIAPKGYASIQWEDWENAIKNDPDTNEEEFEQFKEFLGAAASYIRVYPLRIFLGLLMPMAILAFFTALVLTTRIIRPHPKFMITLCLYGMLIDTIIVMAAITIASRNIIMAGISIIIISVTVYYVGIVWRLIPFSAVNLGVSLEGIRANCCIYNVAFALAKLGFFWMIYWIYVFAGVEMYVGTTYCPNLKIKNANPEEELEDQSCPPQMFAFLLLLLSCYWTSQVINVRAHVMDFN